MFPFQLKVVSIPVNYDFRQIKNREIALFEGPEGWSEFSPFTEYNNKESVTWLKAALEAATKPAPKPIRSEVLVNATLPNIKVDQVAKVLSSFNGCTTIKVKVNDFVHDHLLLQEVLRHIPGAKFRLDVNGGWNLDEAIANSRNYLQEFVGQIDYIEQPCLDIADLKSLRKIIKVPIAVDESIRKYLGSDLTKLKEVADVAIIKWAPTGGFALALEIIEKIQLPVVISSALDSSVGISHGLSLAAAIPNLYGPCGLATVALFEADVTSKPLIAENGKIINRKIVPDLIDAYKAEPARQIWWQDRVNEIYAEVSK